MIGGKPAGDPQKVIVAFPARVPEFQHTHRGEKCVAIALPDRAQFAIGASHDLLTLGTLISCAMWVRGHYEPDLFEAQSA